MAITDSLRRPLRDLRLSVTDWCNLRCQYCMPTELFPADYPFLGMKDLLSYDKLLRIVKSMLGLGLQKIKLTGGEPLLRPGIIGFIKKLAKLDRNLDLGLITNGSYLANKLDPLNNGKDSSMAFQLKSAGLSRLTVSLDALDEDCLRKITGRANIIGHILAGLDLALEAGFKQIKINMVVMKGVNEQEIIPMLRYFKKPQFILRFIEYMDVGSQKWEQEKLMTQSEILDLIAAANDRDLEVQAWAPNYLGEVANRFRYVDGSSEIGFISSISQPFCSNCTRLRLTAEGRVFPCLFSSNGLDLKALLAANCTDIELRENISRFWRKRADRYSEQRSSFQEDPEYQNDKIPMHKLGG